MKWNFPLSGTTRVTSIDRQSHCPALGLLTLSDALLPSVQSCHGYLQLEFSKELGRPLLYFSWFKYLFSYCRWAFIFICIFFRPQEKVAASLRSKNPSFISHLIIKYLKITWGLLETNERGRVTKDSYFDRWCTFFIIICDLIIWLLNIIAWNTSK